MNDLDPTPLAAAFVTALVAWCGAHLPRSRRRDVVLVLTPNESPRAVERGAFARELRDGGLDDEANYIARLVTAPHVVAVWITCDAATGVFVLPLERRSEHDLAIAKLPDDDVLAELVGDLAP